MSENTEKSKPTPEQRASSAGLAIYKSGYSAGKSEGRKESTDPDAKRLGYLVTGAVKLKAKGKTANVKQLRNLVNNIDDENDYNAIEALNRKALLLLANGTKPVKAKTADSPSPPVENPPQPSAN